MAELAASMVVGPLLSLLKEKASNYLLDKYKVMEGMEKQREILDHRLPAILDIIDDAEKQASHRQGVKAWLARLKKVAYEASEVFDDFEYEALRRQAKKNGHITELGIMAGVKLLPTHNRLAFRLRMGTKLRRIVESISDLVTEMNTFGFDRHHQVINNAPTQEEYKWREMDSILVDHADIVSRSRDKERKKIVEILVNGQASHGDDLLVVPIVGMGGLGKTTLAQLIYNDLQVQEHFHKLQKWVCVSDDFNVQNLANKICNSSETSRDGALKKLQEQLSGKRYLLVLDDVWNKDVEKWEKLKACLKHGATGSAVLTTTRDKEIAQFMGTVTDNLWANKYHDVEILQKKFIEEIIKAKAGFAGLPKSKQDELENLVGPIGERCGGSPMAAKALGSVLHNKTTKQEWEDVLQRSSICSYETGILAILKLSYDDLPSNMRQCFAFCALYPKDYHIDVDKLIQLWMANGFIRDKNAEIVGEQIVKQMVSRSFFEYVYQEPIRYGYSSTNFLKIHDLMHDVAMSASQKECACIIDETIESSELLPSVARHIHLQNPSKKRLAILYHSMVTSAPIQTLMLGDLRNTNVQDSSHYSSLRALSMPELWGQDHLIIKPRHILHLRYLDLSGSEIKALPNDISILYSLQTLKLSGCKELNKLPEQMKYMTSLRHLYTDQCHKLECMPPELGKLTSLRTVTCFIVGCGSYCSSLGELKNLDIGGSLEINHLENVTEAMNAKMANLGDKKELRQLSLKWTSGKEEEKQCHEVLEALKAHAGLLALEISSYQGTCFPSWFGMLRSMVELRLSNCRKIEQLPLLCQLPELQLLELVGLEKLQFLCSDCTSSTLGKLKDLKLSSLDNFERFCQGGQGKLVSFPQLQILRIYRCKKLTALPEAPLLREAYGGGDYTMACSAFPRLKSLELSSLCSFERWGAALATEVKHPLFPVLETLCIWTCPQLATLPGAPKLRELEVCQENQRMSLGAATAGYLTSLSTLSLSNFMVDGKDKWDDHMSSSVTDMCLTHCDGLFFQSRALALWSCFGQQLQDLTIKECSDLVHWPEKEFQSLVSLRRLEIRKCDNLIGYAPDLTTSERNHLLPHLESLEIWYCGSLVEVFSNTALKRMDVTGCNKLESLFIPGKQEDKTSLNQGPSTDLLPSSLESIWISGCDGLSEVLNLPSSLREIRFDSCSTLRVLSSKLDALKKLKITWCPELRSLESCVIDLPALEQLKLSCCKSLASLPSGPQEYSSLCQLAIWKCPGIKSIPSALQQRLDSLEY